jgi:HD-like signal output (HDOD) protein
MSLASVPGSTTNADAKSPLGSETELPPNLQKAMTRVTEISSLPEVTTRIVEVVEDPKSTAQDMHEIVKHDPALAAKILKVVNSAFYGLPSQIASLDRAIVLLGLSAVKNIALAASLSRLFRPGAISERFAARDLWTHCISVGVGARLLVRAARAGRVEEAFVAGLVHDMGLLVEYQLFSQKLKTVAERCEAQPQDFCAIEREIIGADHQAFGAALAAKWKFPSGLRCAVSHHHNPDRLKPELRRVVATVQVADTLCAQNRFGFYLTAQAQEVTGEMLELVGVNAGQLDELLEELPERIHETKQIFGE